MYFMGLEKWLNDKEHLLHNHEFVPQYPGHKLSVLCMPVTIGLREWRQEGGILLASNLA